MKVMLFNGSPRKEGNTALLLGVLQEALALEGIACEEIQIGGRVVRGCTACGACASKKGRCILSGDDMNEWIDKMAASDGVVLASPTYFANVTAEMKALIDRAGMVTMNAGQLLRRKVGAPVVVARRGGAMQVYNALMSFFGITQMIVPMSSYWNMGYGLAPGDINTDAEGLDTMKTLGANMAFVLKKINN